MFIEFRTHIASGRITALYPNVVSFPICTLFNRYIEECICPSCIKEARVALVFKNNGDSQLMNNYRPISVLPFRSKVFEKLVHGRMMKFLDQNNILYDGHFGFRPGMGTSDTLLKFIDKAYNSLDDKKFSVPGDAAYLLWGRQRLRKLRRKKRKKDICKPHHSHSPRVSLEGCRFFGRRTPVPLGVLAATVRGRYRGEPGSSYLHL